MRKIAFGYSTRCNIRCSHCVAAGEQIKSQKMELARAREIIVEMALAGVSGISFTAGEPLIYLDDLLDLLTLCRQYKIYTRVVTNSFWAGTTEQAEHHLRLLKQSGLCQMRLSFSRWHQEHIARGNVLNAALACNKAEIDYFVSFVTDFSTEDDEQEGYLREKQLKFFPEPMIYSGRADAMEQVPIRTDYQANCCAMNPYLAPDYTMYACCDAGSHFTTTNVFRLGNLDTESVEYLFAKSESNFLYNSIRTTGISTIASFAGMQSREVITYRKCELCKKLFDTPETLAKLQQAAKGELKNWVR